VRLDDAFDAEAFSEGFPDIRPQPRAGGEADAMRAVARAARLLQQIAAQLSDVHEVRYAVPLHVVDEVTGGKLSPRRERRARVHCRGEADEVRIAMVERGRRVRTSTLAEIEKDAERFADPPQAR